MTVTFLPETGVELLHADESDPGAVATVSAATDIPNEISAITWTVDPDFPAHVIVSAEIAPGGGSAALTVNFPTFAGMIPILGIDYLLGGTIGTVTDWSAVPEEATQIISYRKQASQPIEYTLTLTVEDTMGPASATYTIVVDPNYTGGRDSLIAAVDARR